jgi:predicted PurR-regulated permease PerM
MDKKVIEISSGTIFRAIIIILAIALLYFIRGTIALLFLSIIIVSAIDPAIDWMQRKKIPRILGVASIYLVLLSIVGLSISFLVPPIAEQTREFSHRMPSYVQSIGNSLGNLGGYFNNGGGATIDQQKIVGNFESSISLLPGKIFTETVGIFSGLFSAIIVLVVAFYMAVNEDGIKKFIVSVTPVRHQIYAAHLTTRIEGKMGKWLQGQFLLMIIIFILDWVGLSLLGMPYALTLAIFAGLMEIVPFVGPIISAVPGIIIGFSISPLMGLLVALLYLVTQQFESNIVVPQVMRKAVGLNPIVVILALLVGLELGGIMGAILSIPIATAIGVVVDDIMGEKKLEK